MKNPLRRSQRRLFLSGADQQGRYATRGGEPRGPYDGPLRAIADAAVNVALAVVIGIFLAVALAHWWST